VFDKRGGDEMLERDPACGETPHVCSHTERFRRRFMPSIRIVCFDGLSRASLPMQPCIVSGLSVALEIAKCAD
jgi:hypothetical protein